MSSLRLRKLTLTPGAGLATGSEGLDLQFTSDPSEGGVWALQRCESLPTPREGTAVGLAPQVPAVWREVAEVIGSTL